MLRSTLTASVLALALTNIHAGTIVDGTLNVSVNDGNGAFSSISWGGSEFFARGTYVSDYGFQLGANDSTYAFADNYGNLNGWISVSSTVTGSSTIVSTGTYLGMFDFTRTYTVSGGNTVKVTTKVTNNGTDAATIRSVNAYDPDQGIDLGTGFSTTDDVVTSGSTKYGISTEQTGYTVAAVTHQPSTIEAGGNFGLWSGTTVNNFFDYPVDGNGALNDAGLNVGFESLLAAGASTSWEYCLVFGATPGEVIDHLDCKAVPEPTTMALLALGSAGVLALRRRRSA